MIPRPVRASAIALGAAAFALFSPFAAANAATVTHHYRQVAHPRVPHAVHGYVARTHTGHRHYVWRNGHRYVYGSGYNPGAAVAAGVIGGVLGAAAAYPYSCDYSYYGSYGGCGYGDYGWGGYYAPYYGGFGYGYAPGFYGGNHGYGFARGFHGGGARFASGNFGHMGVGGGHVGGFGGGHMGGFGGGHFGGGGAHFR